MSSSVDTRLRDYQSMSFSHYCLLFRDKTDSFIGEALLSRFRLVKILYVCTCTMHFPVILASNWSTTTSGSILLKTNRYPTQMSRQKRPVARYTFRSKDKISLTIRLLPSPITGSRMTPVTARGTDHPRRLVSSLVVQGRQWKDWFVFDRFLEVNLITLLKK